MNTREATAQKVEEIKQELKATGMWRQQPGWVQEYEENGFGNRRDFLDWLQFVYLPNRLQPDSNRLQTVKYIVPQAMAFFEKDIEKGKLLQLLIELDAL